MDGSGVRGGGRGCSRGWAVATATWAQAGKQDAAQLRSQGAASWEKRNVCVRTRTAPELMSG